MYVCTYARTYVRLLPLTRSRESTHVCTTHTTHMHARTDTTHTHTHTHTHMHEHTHTRSLTKELQPSTLTALFGGWFIGPRRTGQA